MWLSSERDPEVGARLPAIQCVRDEGVGCPTAIAGKRAPTLGLRASPVGVSCEVSTNE
jgi:hypothetical protein